MRPHKGKKSVGRTQTVRRGNCGWSSLGMVRQTCPDPCLVLKTRVCLRHGVDLFGRNVRKQLKCVFLSVCRAPSRLVETVVSNSLIFLTSHHLLWQTRFLFRIVLGLFISGPVSSPLTTSLSSALVCFFYPLQTFILNVIQRGLPFQPDSFPKSFLFKFPSSVIS